ncbi:hypothetical protein [Nostoc sp.]
MICNKCFPNTQALHLIDGEFMNMVEMAAWEFFAIAQIFLLI